MFCKPRSTYTFYLRKPKIVPLFLLHEILYFVESSQTCRRMLICVMIKKYILYRKVYGVLFISGIDKCIVKTKPKRSFTQGHCNVTRRFTLNCFLFSLFLFLLVFVSFCLKNKSLKSKILTSIS